MKNERRKKHSATKRIAFDYVSKPLTDIINEYAALLGFNIILPQGALAITSRVTYRLQEKITVEQGWQKVLMLLDLAGYTLRPDGDFQAIVKTVDNPNLMREPFELFVDVPVDQLPNTDQIIRALFYLGNISIKVTGNDLMAVLKDMLSPTADIKLDMKTNSILLTDKSVNIRGVMKIIQELDEGGLRDTIEVLPLYYVSASTIDDLFNKQLFAQQQQQNGGAAPLPQASYFPRNTKVLALERTNSLVIMGTPGAISQVKDFIIKYIDRSLESGESILHLYDLQYLNASEFAPILQQLVSPTQAQTTQTTGKVTGPRQYFKGVIVQAEITRKTEQLQPTAPAGTPTGSATPTTEGTQIGGNRLIIAARKNDWIRIKKLIQDLDKPQPQVALEVLIVDLTLTNDRFFGSQMRDKKGLQSSISPKFNFQSAQLNSPILKTIDNPTGGDPILPGDALMANLLQILNNADPNAVNASSPQNLATLATPGSMIISLGDAQTGGVWAVFQLLNRFANTTILAQPFLVTTNHQQATVTIQQERLIKGDADTANTSVALRFETVTAGLTVDILPHISLTNNVNLQVTVNLNEFVSNVSNNRITRVVQTSANVGSGEILALGGLIRDRENISVNQTPLLSKIPLIGWFFKAEEKNLQKNNLLIFIAPVIIEPRLRGGVEQFTQQKLAYAQSNLEDALCFENLRDPITRWFFKPDVTFAERTIDSYRKHSLFDEDNRIEAAAASTGALLPPVTGSSPDDLAFAQDDAKLKALASSLEKPHYSSIESAN
jgi:general secretion pathway protein D